MPTTISKDDSITLEAVVDRDTMGLPGSPSIVESITAKIARSDLFIADVSIVSPRRNLRPTPNPNVLIELGTIHRLSYPSKTTRSGGGCGNNDRPRVAQVVIYASRAFPPMLFSSSLVSTARRNTPISKRGQFEAIYI